MFEAVMSLCLGALCRDMLLPGYEAASAEVCAALLAEQPSDNKAFCRPAGPALPFEEVAPGVFVHQGVIAEPDPQNGGDVSNIGFVIGDASVAVIDTGGARWVGEGTWRAIRERTDLPVSHVVLTHMHPDHVFGAEVFADAGAEIVGHHGLERALADRVENYLEGVGAAVGPEKFFGTVAPGPVQPVETMMEIDLGGRSLALRAWPTAHTPTDLTVEDRVTGTLFAGDLVFDRHTPALDGSLLGWEAVLEALEDARFARVVPGHGQVILQWPQGVAPLDRYLAVLEKDTRAALDEGLRIGEAAESVARSEAGNWALFEAYNPRNATVAYTELEWE